jgi:hypothetical protein
MEKYNIIEAYLWIDDENGVSFPLKTGLTMDEPVASMLKWFNDEGATWLEIKYLKKDKKEVFNQKELEKYKDKKIRDLLSLREVKYKGKYFYVKEDEEAMKKIVDFKSVTCSKSYTTL